MRRLGLQVVSNLSSDLSNEKRAATMDSEVLSSDVLKLSKGTTNLAEVVQLIEKAGFDESSQKFTESMNYFIRRYFHRGTIREMFGYYKEAIDDFKYALVLEPTNKRATSAVERLRNLILKS